MSPSGDTSTDSAPETMGDMHKHTVNTNPTAPAAPPPAPTSDAGPPRVLAAAGRCPPSRPAQGGGRLTRNPSWSVTFSHPVRAVVHLKHARDMCEHRLAAILV